HDRGDGRGRLGGPAHRSVGSGRFGRDEEIPVPRGLARPRRLFRRARQERLDGEHRHVRWRDAGAPRGRRQGDRKSTRLNSSHDSSPTRRPSDLTTEVTGEGGSVAPLTDRLVLDDSDAMKKYRYREDWRDLDGYFAELARNGSTVNIATFVGATQVRLAVVGKEIGRAHV